MRQMLAIAHSNSQRLSALINDLLDMDKLEADVYKRQVPQDLHGMAPAPPDAARRGVSRVALAGGTPLSPL